METDPRAWIATLRRSQERLADLVAALTPEQLRGQSFCTDWTVAQVLSHLGSGAEIGLLMLPAALGETEAPGREQFQPVWDAWNAKSPDEQAADVLTADDRNVRGYEALTDEQLAKISLPFFGMALDAIGLIRLRLGEHTLHTWDVEVFTDPAAAVPADAAALLVDNVPQFLAPRLGKAPADPYAARIRTTDPERDYLLATAENVVMTEYPESGTDVPVGEVTMPAEALIRLAYGRLDEAHTPPSVTGAAADLSQLRSIFPGF
jgi:uncharacterized protein (TIGR03083 family)